MTLPTVPVHSPVTVTPAGDSIATCSLRVGGEAPHTIQSAHGCGMFAEWEVTAPTERDERDERDERERLDLYACNRHLAAAVRYLSEQADLRRTRR